MPPALWRELLAVLASRPTGPAFWGWRCSNLSPLITTQTYPPLPGRFDNLKEDQQRLMFTNPFTNGMKTAPGEFSGGRFDW
jgi:hypothetical protein